MAPPPRANFTLIVANDLSGGGNARPGLVRYYRCLRVLYSGLPTPVNIQRIYNHIYIFRRAK